MTVVVFQWSIHRNIQSDKGINIHSNIQTVIFKKIIQEIFNLILKHYHYKTFFKHKNCSLIFQPENAKWHPERRCFPPGNIQGKIYNFDVN